YLESYTRHADFGAKSRLALSALSILLLISMLVVLLKLQRTSLSLANLDLTLEEKVASRTEELKAVLHKLEEQQQILTHTAKMGALGEMAGGIAHEINTPLAAISLLAELLALEAAELNEPKLLDGLNSISKIVEKISKIVIGLKRFSRTGEAGVRVRTSFEMIVDETLLLCAEKLKLRGVVLELCDNDKKIDLECAPEQVSQIILNLLNNAVDAVENSAVRKIAMSCQVLNGVLEVRVSDSGPGIPPEVRDRLMQPFFTTKPIGKGTGLGLSISKGIAASHGGSLELDKLSLQTCFVLKLPVAAPIATLDPAA
ncbi:MAG: GHKL domain-containing protein, partial [Proteobacteria bacterium]